MNERLLFSDFGSQKTKLIDRKVRVLNVRHGVMKLQPSQEAKPPELITYKTGHRLQKNYFIRFFN